MAINNKDDYEKLAKILYPSIEASGNVYYGQTRKLTMDEILGKNELNFESHIETFKQGDQTYKSYFNWKIGPLHGDIEVASLGKYGRITLDNFPSSDYFTILNCDGTTTQVSNIDADIFGFVFAKYRIISQQNAVSNLTNSASYITYENKFITEYIGLYTSETNVVVINDYYFLVDGARHFFITNESDSTYIYIVIASKSLNNNISAGINSPFKVIAKQNNSSVKLIFSTDEFEYNLNGNEWLDYSSNTVINLPKINNYVEFRIKGYASQSRCPQFTFTGIIELAGNIFSLYNQYYYAESVYYTLSSDYFREAFFNCTQIVDASALILPSRSLEADYAYSCMFRKCSNLIYPPELPAENVYNYAYESMFSLCTSLKIAPNLNNLQSISHYACSGMFSGCTSLQCTPIFPNIQMLENHCYDDMFHGCTNLRIANIVFGTHLNSDCCSNMFNSCTALKSVCIDSKSITSDYYNYFLNGVETSGTLFVPDDFNVVGSDTIIPATWSIKRINPDSYTLSKSNNGFTCSLYNQADHNAIPTMSISGSDSVLNGRGKLTDSTMFNMLDQLPNRNTYDGWTSCTTYGEYDSASGSFNQEIWGYKCFNSPVTFRNGIYGECASLTTSDISGVEGLTVFSNGVPVTYVEPHTMRGSEFKVLPKNPSTFYGYNPRAYLEVLHVNTEGSGTREYNMCESQVGIYSHNNYDTSDNIKFINRSALYEDPVPLTGDFASFITNASLNVDTDPTLVRITEYTAIASAGNTYIKLSGGTDRDGNETRRIEISSTTLPSEDNSFDLGSFSSQFSTVYCNTLYCGGLYGPKIYSSGITEYLCIPYYSGNEAQSGSISSSSSIPVGSLLVLYAGVTVNRGNTFTCEDRGAGNKWYYDLSNTPVDLRITDIENTHTTEVEASYFELNAKIVALSSSPAGVFCPFLAMRVK